MTASRHRQLAYVAIVLGIISIGFSGIFVALANAPGPVSGFYRMAFAAVALTPIFWRRRPAAIHWRDVRFALIGGVFFACDLSLWNSGVLISGATNPTLMGNTAPVWVGLASMLLFGKKLGRKFWSGLLLALLGAAVILGLDALRNVGLGTFMGLLASFFYAGYYLVSERGRRALDTVTFMWFVMVAASLTLVVIAVLFGEPLTGYTPATYGWLLALAIVVQLLGHFWLSYALGYLPASLVAPTMLGQPVMTAILAGPILGEALTPGQLVGGTAVLAGIFIVHRSWNNQQPTASSQRLTEKRVNPQPGSHELTR